MPAFLSSENSESPKSIASEVAIVSRIEEVHRMLDVICGMTGMGYAVVARVTERSWTVCAIRDDIGFGLRPGSQVPVETTLCHESRMSRETIAFDQASLDPVYRDHHTPRVYGVESYISEPIIRLDGSYFGNLCAADRKPADASSPKVRAMFKLFVRLLAYQLESEERRQADAAALMDARAVSELREQFIAVLGHDLRNPISAVAAGSELLIRREARDAEGAKIGRRMRATARRMAALIDDVMDFARGRMGTGMGVEFKPVGGLGELLGSVVEELRLANPDREIVAEIEPIELARCDPGRLQQLLSNLLGNALAHGARGRPVTVEAAVRGQVLELSVENFGKSIDPENLVKVFEPYWRPAGSRPGGLGLGLYICAQIAKAHGGSIRARSSEEGGTLFTALIPVGAPA